MINFLNWIFKYWGLMLISIPEPVVEVIPDTTELDKFAKDFVAQLNEDRFKGTSGEYKRSQVMRMLMNHFPDTRERDLAWAIENAVRS
jgi:hypothetical protein